MIIQLGNFFFRWRDTLFGLIFLLGLYLLTFPESNIYFYGIGSLQEDIGFSIIGFFLVVLGISIRVVTIGYIYIKRAGIQKKIHADTLFKEGLFAHSRNPLYIGNLFIITGGIVSMNQIIFWLFILPLFYFIYYSIIKAEENFLIRKFGNEYQKYLQEVPGLWFGNFHQFPDSFRRVNFSLKRVIKVEHSTQFLILFTISLINLIKFRYRYGFPWNHPFFQFLYGCMVFLVMYQLLAYWLKKTNRLEFRR